MENIKVQSIAGINPEEYITGTIFELPTGQLWRVGGRRLAMVLIRMTRKDGTLKAGEDCWMQPAR